VLRTEQAYSGGWNDEARLTYRNNTLGWQNYEEREEYSGGWSSKYDITQTYDKVGNRSTFHKNTVAAGTYGRDVKPRAARSAAYRGVSRLGLATARASGPRRGSMDPRSRKDGGGGLRRTVCGSGQLDPPSTF